MLCCCFNKTVLVRSSSSDRSDYIRSVQFRSDQLYSSTVMNQKWKRIRIRKENENDVYLIVINNGISY